jgi:hypothetical protein
MAIGVVLAVEPPWSRFPYLIPNPGGGPFLMSALFRGTDASRTSWEVGKGQRRKSELYSITPSARASSGAGRRRDKLTRRRANQFDFSEIVSSHKKIFRFYRN